MEENYIILNKPFVGNYLNNDNHDAHEIINFFKADNGMHFIYNNPYGQFIAKQNGVTPKVEYVVFTSKTKDKSFFIKYVAKIECALHSATISKKEITCNKNKSENYIKTGQEEIASVLKEKYNINSIDDITYDGMKITELFSDELNVLPFTFVCSGLYVPKKPIKIDGDDDLFDYNFQRNFGYVSEISKNPNAYKVIKEHLDNLPKEFKPLKVEKFKAVSVIENKEELDSLEQNTFLDLISLHKEEECYTKIIGNLLSCNQDLVKELVRTILLKKKTKLFFEDSDIKSIKNIKGSFSYGGKYLDTELDIKNVGRIDLYSESKNCRLIIENKLECGINFITKNNETKDQLNRYYEYFNQKREKDGKSNIFVLLAPEYNHDDLMAEIDLLPNNMKDHWFLIGYSDIYDLIKENETVIKETKYGKYYDDLLLLMKRYSFAINELVKLKLTKNKIK